MYTHYSEGAWENLRKCLDRTALCPEDLRFGRGICMHRTSQSWVELRQCQYPAPAAKLVWTQTDNGLLTEVYSFDPLTAAADLFASQGGLTINGITWPGVDHVENLAGRTLELSAETEPELCESVFWHQGETLEIERLSVTCVAVEKELCRLELTAVLRDISGGEVQATASLLATVHTHVA